MRVLLLPREFPPEWGGLGRVFYDLAVEMTAAGHEVRVVIPQLGQHRGTYYYAKLDIIGTTRRGNKFLNWVIWLWTVVWQIVQFRPQHVMLGGSEPQLFYALIGALVPIPVTVMVVGSDVLKAAHGMRNYLTRHLLNHAAHIAAISEYTKSLTLSLGNYAYKTHVIPIGIDLDDYKMSVMPAERASWGIAPEDNVIITVGRLTPRKGHDVVVHALQGVKYKHAVKYVIVGDGEYRATLEQIAALYEVHENVIFTGAVTDEQKIQLYDMADIFVGMSRGEGAEVEGFGIVFLEAAARGLACIGGNHGGVPEAIGSGGMVIAPDDYERLSKQIDILLRNEQMLKTMGARGRERVYSRFSRQQMARSYLQLFELKLAQDVKLETKKRLT